MQQNLLSVLVSNHFGVLMRVTTIFTRRTCNINSLTVAETQDSTLSRITILFEGTPEQARQIHRLLEKQEDVLHVTLMSTNDPLIRELCLVKVTYSPQLCEDLVALQESYHIKTLSQREDTSVIEFIGTPVQIENFVHLMEQYGIVEICRTGAAAVGEGDSSIYESISY